MNTNDITIRLEKREDHRAVENLIRESFWNVYRPGCYEHYVMHVLRDDPAFVHQLDFVLEKDGRLIGQNMFMRTRIDADDGRCILVLTMGPICITPRSNAGATERSCWMPRWSGLRPWASEPYCLKATLTSTARAALSTPGTLASATTICRRARMTPSSSAGS